MPGKRCILARILSRLAIGPESSDQTMIFRFSTGQINYLCASCFSHRSIIGLKGR